MPFEPKGLGEHPFRRHHARDEAEDGVSGNANLGGFAEGALIHPQQSFSERRTVFPAGQDRASCAIQADAGDVAGLDLTTSQGLRDGFPRRLPPFQGILFCPAGLRVSCVDRRSCKRAAITRRVNDRGPKTLRADVYAEEKRGHGF